jgi:hypothetical protein
MQISLTASHQQSNTHKPTIKERKKYADIENHSPREKGKGATLVSGIENYSTTKEKRKSNREQEVSSNTTCK